MNASELKTELQSLGVSPRIYSLRGPVNERVCLEQRGREWLVSFYERGAEAVLGVFATESDACEFMLKELRSEAR